MTSGLSHWERLLSSKGGRTLGTDWGLDTIPDQAGYVTPLAWLAQTEDTGLSQLSQSSHPRLVGRGWLGLGDPKGECRKDL